MSYHLAQFRDLIKRTLRDADLPRKPEAIDLLLGTSAQESHLGTYLRQTNGPALGAFQMEPVTFQWVQEWAEHRYQPRLIGGRRSQEMEWDLRLAIIAARLNYLSKPRSIPVTLEGQASYWKKYWNMYIGKGTISEYMANWRRYCV